MRIVFVAPFGLGQKSTIWARTLPLAQELTAQEHTVAILIPPWDTPGHAAQQWWEGDVRLVNVALRGGLPLILRRLLHEINEFKPDIVHIVKPIAHAGLVQWWLWQRRQFSSSSHPRIFLDVDDWEQAWLSVNTYPWPVARFLRGQEAWGIRHADAITAASRWLTARAHAYTPQTPVLYLPNGVTAPDPPPPSSVRRTANHDQQTVLFFSRFVEVEPDWLAAFWRALRTCKPRVRLCIAGNALQPGRKAQFQRALVRADAMSGVEMAGFVEPDQLSRMYARADCAIFPSQDTPLHAAKCSVRLATTLLHGVPVVASAVGQQAVYGAQGAAVLIPPDAAPAEFAAAVAAVLDQPHWRAQLGRQARAHLLDRFNWQRLGSELAQFYADNL